MRRLADTERPLELALSWSHHGVVNKKFVLQENDTGDILVGLVSAGTAAVVSTRALAGSGIWDGSIFSDTGT